LLNNYRHKPQATNNNTPLLNDHDDNSNPALICQRHKSPIELTESLKTTITNDNRQELTKTQPHELHKYLSNVLYMKKKC